MLSNYNLEGKIMPKYDLSKRIVNGELTRRQMLKGLGAAGVISTTVPLLPKTAFAKSQVQICYMGWIRR